MLLAQVTIHISQNCAVLVSYVTHFPASILHYKALKYSIKYSLLLYIAFVLNYIGSSRKTRKRVPHCIENGAKRDAYSEKTKHIIKRNLANWIGTKNVFVLHPIFSRFLSSSIPVLHCKRGFSSIKKPGKGHFVRNMEHLESNKN